jgi:fumarate reductase subunit D
LPTALSDNVKFLKAVEWGMSKSTTAVLSPALILPLGILVPLVAAKIWKGHPLKQFLQAYLVHVTLIPILDGIMLYMVPHHPQHQNHHHHYNNNNNTMATYYWLAIAALTAGLSWVLRKPSLTLGTPKP